MNHSVKLILIIFVALNCLFFVLTGCSKDAEYWTPQVVPYLDNVPSDIDGQGSAVLKPSEPIPVSSKRDFKLTFTPIKSKICTKIHLYLCDIICLLINYA